MKLMMNKKFKQVLAALMLVAMMLGTASTALAADSAYDTLVTALVNGKSADLSINYTGTDNYYKTSGGGYVYWSSLVSATSNTIIVESQFELLTTGGKQDFLEDFIALAYYMDENSDSISAETVDDVFNNIQNVSGMGSLLMSSLLSDINPDYSTANSILEPFNGVVGVALGVLSIFIMGALGLTMALDIAFVTIPALQIVLGDGGNGQGGGGQTANAFSKIISAEARAAVSESEGGGQGGSGGGGRQSGIGIYFKYRWKGLIILGICLLYLVQGEIYSGIAMLINLLSGFLGF